MRPLRKATTRRWGGYLTTDFTDGTDGIQRRVVFIRAIRGSSSSASVEFRSGLRLTVETALPRNQGRDVHSAGGRMLMLSLRVKGQIQNPDEWLL